MCICAQFSCTEKITQSNLRGDDTTYDNNGMFRQAWCSHTNPHQFHHYHSEFLGKDNHFWNMASKHTHQQQSPNFLMCSKREAKHHSDSVMYMDVVCRMLVTIYKYKLKLERSQFCQQYHILMYDANIISLHWLLWLKVTKKGQLDCLCFLP